MRFTSQMQLARRRTMAEVFTTISYRRAPTKTKEALCPGVAFRNGTTILIHQPWF